MTRWTFLIALTNVEGAGMKHAAWKNWANYFLVLFIWKMPLAVGAGRLVRVNGIYQRPFGSVVFACEDYFFVTVHDLQRYLFKNGLAHTIT